MFGEEWSAALTRKTEKTVPKQLTPFKPGQSGNPAGRKGARHKTTIAIEALLDGEADALTRKAIELAKDGDLQALRLCMDRIAPPRKDSFVVLELPKMETAGDAVKAIGAIVDAVSIGELTPSEADVLSRIVQQFSKTIETAELEQRIKALEETVVK